MTNRDGSRLVRMLQVELSADDDIQSVEMIRPGGDDFSPPDGTRVFIVQVGPAYKLSLGVDDKVEPQAAKGDHWLYAIDGAGDAASIIKLIGNGTAEILGDTDFAVRYSALETAFNQLKSDFDTHVHSGVTSGGSSTAVTTPSTADITGAKINEIKVP